MKMSLCLSALYKDMKASGGGGESNGESSAKRPRVDMSSLPTRQYLDQTVVPILLQAVTQLNKESFRRLHTFANSRPPNSQPPNHIQVSRHLRVPTTLAASPPTTQCDLEIL
ncbi:uncharacterized protein [Cherax quadricarinatus]|uniref:uncharacterized protein isoform X4 n=1 Tax=Cherax quadricarinatus TaxID=27406 RepID=UPI00387E50FF